MKAGFVVILGRPNVGKSTLLNRLVGSKIAIATPKPQTTRDAIQGVLTRPEGQIVFVDSPGIHEPSLELGRHMMREVRRATAGCHLVLLLVDASQPNHMGDRAAIEIVRELDKAVLLVINKVDLVKSKQALLPQLEDYQKRHDFAELVPISAHKGDNLDVLVKLLFDRLPESPNYYPEDYITDQPERFLAAELIREQIILQTHREVPHSAAVTVDTWEEEPNLLRISATVYVERAGQKGIMIGARGEKMKKIGTHARKQLESFFDRKVFLEIFVKVSPRWRDHPAFLKSLDFHEMLGTDSPTEGPQQ